MAFLGNKSLTELLEKSDVIAPFRKERIENGVYELSLGDQVFLTDSSPKVVQTLNDNQEIYIKPGQFALLLTEEKVKIPQNRIAFISIKAGIKWKGLVNVSGFHVDAGFEGKLLFSVYNAGSFTICLRKGEKCFPIWFAELDGSQTYNGKHKNQSMIPLEPIQALSQVELATPNVLNEKIEKIKSDFENRIGLIEKEQTAKDYLVKAALGLFLVIVVKLGLDYLSYDNGFKKGIEQKQKEATADSIINQRLIEKKNLMLQIDSMEKVKSKIESSIPKTQPNQQRDGKH